jgi:hypothetical protein
VLEPDARLFAHAQPGFTDLRIVTPQGRQVAWRHMPEPPAVERRPLSVVYRGTQDGKAVALLDAGASRPTLGEIELDIAGSDFVGRADVLGSDDRKAFTKLSSTVVYDITGAESARSTTAVFPAASTRYYLVRISGVPAVTGAIATVASTRVRETVEPVVEIATLRQRLRRTMVTLDSARRAGRSSDHGDDSHHDHEIQEESPDGRVGVCPPSGLPDWWRRRSVSYVEQYVRTIENGDDAPQRSPGDAAADSRAILVRGGDAGLLRLLYGNRALGPPQYDFDRLPVSALDLGVARPATLGVESRVPASIPAPDVESFAARLALPMPRLAALASALRRLPQAMTCGGAPTS